MDDRKIIELFFARDEKAVSETEKAYGSLCKKIAKNILGDSLDAEECVNDTLLALWNKIPPEKPDPFKSYICRVARNLALKKYEYNTAKKRNSAYDKCLEEIEDFISDDDSPEKKYELNELTGLIENFLTGLKKTDRIIFVRRFWFADSYEDIALSTGLSIKNISVRLTRLKKSLRKYLESEGTVL